MEIDRRGFIALFAWAAAAIAVDRALGADSPPPEPPPLPADTVYGPEPLSELLSAEILQTLADLGYAEDEVRRAAQHVRDAAKLGTWDDLLQGANWPVDLYDDVDHFVLNSVSDMPRSWGSAIPMELRQLFVGQAISTMLINAQGLMYGDGELWLGSRCLNDTCSSHSFGVISVSMEKT